MPCVCCGTTQAFTAGRMRIGCYLGAIYTIYYFILFGQCQINTTAGYIMDFMLSIAIWIAFE